MKANPYILSRDLIDMDYDGDDPRADSHTDIWMDAATAFDNAIHPSQHGLCEWQCRMQAAIKVLYGDK